MTVASNETILLNDAEAAKFLNSVGLIISPATLRSWRSLRLNRGPTYIKRGIRVCYPVNELEAWAKSREAYRFREPVELA